MTEFFEVPMGPVQGAEDKARMRLVMDACVKMIEVLTAAPPEAHMAILLSFFISACVNANDPEGTWDFLKEDIDRKLPAAVAQIRPLSDRSKAN